MKKGIIVSFEGIDGCGKTTLSKKFYNYLTEKNIIQ
jgi:thymidylate kinase